MSEARDVDAQILRILAADEQIHARSRSVNGEVAITDRRLVVAENERIALNVAIRAGMEHPEIAEAIKAEIDSSNDSNLRVHAGDLKTKSGRIPPCLRCSTPDPAGSLLPRVS